MRDERKWWKAAAVLGVAAIALAVAGCSDRGSGAVEDVVETAAAPVDDSGQGSEAPPVADPAPAADEQASVADEHDAIAQKIDELFARLTAETEDNAKLLETIVELQSQVKKLQLQLVDVCMAIRGGTRYLSVKSCRVKFYESERVRSESAPALPPRPESDEERPDPVIRDYTEGPRLELHQPEADLPARPTRVEL